MACVGVDVRHKPQAHNVSRVIQLHIFFPCVDNSLHSHRDSHNTLVSVLHLFQTFVGVCDGEAIETICCIVIGYHECPLKVNVVETFSALCGSKKYPFLPQGWFSGLNPSTPLEFPVRLHTFS